MKGLCSLQLLLLSENEYLEWKYGEHQAASFIFADVVALLASFLPLGHSYLQFPDTSFIFYQILALQCGWWAVLCCLLGASLP